MEEKRHGGAGRVIVVILILAVLLAAGAFFLFGGRVRVETPSFSTGYRYDRAKDYATLDTFPVEGVTAEKVELHWISGRVEIRAAETISVSENFAGDDAQRLIAAGGHQTQRSTDDKGQRQCADSRLQRVAQTQQKALPMCPDGGPGIQ